MATLSISESDTQPMSPVPSTPTFADMLSTPDHDQSPEFDADWTWRAMPAAAAEVTTPPICSRSLLLLQSSCATASTTDDGQSESDSCVDASSKQDVIITRIYMRDGVQQMQVSTKRAWDPSSRLQEYRTKPSTARYILSASGGMRASQVPDTTLFTRSVRRRITHLVLRDDDEKRLRADADTYTHLRSIHFHGEKLPVAELLDSVLPVQSLQTLWLRSFEQLKLCKKPLPHVSTLVITQPVQQPTDLPSNRWITERKGGASVCITAVSALSAVVWHWLDDVLPTHPVPLQHLYLGPATASVGQPPMTPDQVITVFYGKASQGIWLCNPRCPPNVMEEADECVAAMPSRPFVLSPDLHTLWLDCFFASAFFMLRYFTQATALPRYLDTLMLAVSPYGRDPQSQTTSLFHLDCLCRELVRPRARRLVIKMPIWCQRDEFYQWGKMASRLFQQLVRGNAEAHVTIMPPRWLWPDEELVPWKAMVEVDGFQHERYVVRDIPYLPGPPTELIPVTPVGSFASLK